MSLDARTETPDWTSPGVFEVAPGVHRIPLPLPDDGLRAVNVYAVLDGDGVVLVDSGWALPESLALLERGLAELGADLRDVHQVLVTHVHRDHYTQALTLRERVGTPVVLGVGERPSLEVIMGDGPSIFERQRSVLLRQGADELAAMVRTPTSGPSEWGLPDTWLDEHATVPLDGRTLASIPTPGHTRGHVVFVDEAAGLLFAGDHVLPSITPSIGVEPYPERLVLREYLGSLRLVRSLPDRVLLPAHGAPGGSVHTRIDELLAHHDTRLDDTLAAVTQGCTVHEVASALRWTRRGRTFASLDVFNQVLAVGETSAHLDLLVHTGRLTGRDVDGVTRFG